MYGLTEISVAGAEVVECACVIELPNFQVYIMLTVCRIAGCCEQDASIFFISAKQKLQLQLQLNLFYIHVFMKSYDKNH